jgi:hypothetical protein
MVVGDLGSFAGLKPINFFDILYSQLVFLVSSIKVDVGFWWLFV